MSIVDPVLLPILFLVVAISAWNFARIEVLNRRLTSLEKEHLALVEELEERLFRA